MSARPSRSHRAISSLRLLVEMRREAREALYRLLPPMMDFYATRLGRLPFKPMLFASVDPEPPKGSELSMQGGVLPRQVGAMEQFHPQMGFQRLHQLRHARPARLQRLGGPGEAAGLDHTHKGLHCVDTVHAGSNG
jgi:hypothetical protein